MRPLIFKIFLVFLLGANILAFLFLRQVTPSNEMRVYFFDIGQGDSMLVETANRRQILIDGGPSNAVIQKLGATLPFFDRTIDMLVLTHTDADHITGVVEVLRRYKVKAVLDTGIQCSSGECAAYQSELQSELQKGGIRIIAQLGQRIVLDEQTALTVLHPLDSFYQKSTSSPNETSIVLSLDIGQHSLLFTGDIGERTEEKLVLAGLNLDADILKVPHHGSRYSSSELFLNAITPQIAIVSAGSNNRYGHPTVEILERLENIGAQVYRTDVQGDIVLHARPDGNLWITKDPI